MKAPKLSKELNILISGTTELYDTDLDSSQVVVPDSESLLEILNDFECRVCTKITKNILVCKNGNCSIPVCDVCSQ